MLGLDATKTQLVAMRRTKLQAKDWKCLPNMSGIFRIEDYKVRHNLIGKDDQTSLSIRGQQVYRAQRAVGGISVHPSKATAQSEECSRKIFQQSMSPSPAQLRFILLAKLISVVNEKICLGKGESLYETTNCCSVCCVRFHRRHFYPWLRGSRRSRVSGL